MPKKNMLSKDERIRIDAFKETGLSKREIARRINRSEAVVRNYIKLGQKYGEKGKRGLKSKLSVRDKRAILNEARKGNAFSSQIKAKLNLPVTSRRIRQICNSDPNLKFTKRLKKPPLTERHKESRLKFAEKNMNWTTEWNSVFFTDEKKFNLDGPDGWQYYWHDLRKEPEVRMSRNFGGGSVMIWGGFGAFGKTDLAWIPPKMNANTYVELLDSGVLEKAEEICGANLIYQQDNAAVHAAKVVKEFFKERNVQVLDWPARSPDLNPIENLWGILSRKVYKNGRQYQSTTELKNAIRRAWREISRQELESLTNSMPKRLFQIILNKGGSTRY